MGFLSCYFSLVWTQWGVGIRGVILVVRDKNEPTKGSHMDKDSRNEDR